MHKINQPLGYLREILAGHTDNSTIGKEIYDKLTKSGHSTEEYFVRSLTGEEMYYLNSVLVEAIDYSNQEQDYERARQLNAVYEILTI